MIYTVSVNTYDINNNLYASEILMAFRTKAEAIKYMVNQDNYMHPSYEYRIVDTFLEV